MPDLGGPSSYLALPDGADVDLANGERIGTVTHVLAVADDTVPAGLSDRLKRAWDRLSGNA